MRHLLGAALCALCAAETAAEMTVAVLEHRVRQRWEGNLAHSLTACADRRWRRFAQKKRESIDEKRLRPCSTCIKNEEVFLLCFGFLGANIPVCLCSHLVGFLAGPCSWQLSCGFGDSTVPSGRMDKTFISLTLDAQKLKKKKQTPNYLNWFYFFRPI